MAESLKRSHHETAILEAEKSFNTIVISTAIIDAMRVDPTFCLAQAETILRDNDTNTYLVAVPTQFAPPDLTVKSLSQEPRDYFLWVCLHGCEEAREKLASIGTATADDNLQNLRYAGLLTVR